MKSIFKLVKINLALLLFICSILILSNSNICNAYDEYDFTIEDVELRDYRKNWENYPQNKKILTDNLSTKLTKYS